MNAGIIFKLSHFQIFKLKKNLPVRGGFFNQVIEILLNDHLTGHSLTTCGNGVGINTCFPISSI